MPVGRSIRHSLKKAAMLWKSNAFIRGAFATFEIMPEPRRAVFEVSHHPTTRSALASDWVAIGDDLRVVYDLQKKGP